MSPHNLTGLIITALTLLGSGIAIGFLFNWDPEDMLWAKRDDAMTARWNIPASRESGDHRKKDRKEIT